MKYPKHREKHGMTGSPEYKAWYAMKHRCTNTADPYYSHYGARGITVCDAWLRSFTAFYTDVGARPAPGYSLDRIDNDRGYEPGNVKWSTQSQQNRNRRMITKTGYKGVYYHAKSGGYYARISINNKTRSLGYFKKPEDAAAVYQTKAAELCLT